MQHDRRDSLKLIGGALLGAALTAGCGRTTEATDMTTATRDGATGARPWYAPLGQALDDEYDYQAEVEGDLPADLRGTLYRNGPGLFERAGYRKGHLLDGDGMIRAFDFTDAGVRFRNRFVRTTKYVAEQAAGRYLHATWGTRAPGGMLANVGGGNMISQAGVTPVVWDGRLLAFDETGLPWALDLASLETQGEYRVGPDAKHPAYKAHTKFDGETGDWILLGNSYGPSMHLHVIVYGADGRMCSSQRVKSPRMTYVHDFFATARYVVINLHAVSFSPFAMLAGMKTFTESLTWEPEQGNLVLIIDKSGEHEPVTLEAPVAWMWHALNAYEDGNNIVADFVAYDTPDHFIGDDPALSAVMQGRAGQAQSPGTIRRWHIDLAGSSLREETLDAGHFEFPIVDPRVGNRRHEVGYFAAAGATGEWWHSGLARLDMASGNKRSFDFGPHHYCGEPIFAARPGGAVDDGWLLAEVFDADAGRSSIAVFDAATPDQGPVARVNLRHHLPISFHGTWHAA